MGKWEQEEGGEEAEVHDASISAKFTFDIPAQVKVGTIMKVMAPDKVTLQIPCSEGVLPGDKMVMVRDSQTGKWRIHHVIRSEMPTISVEPSGDVVRKSDLELESDLKDPTVQLVCLETTKGPIQLKIVPSWAPRGSQRFLQLVTDGYYEDMAIYRAVPNFLIQFGVTDDPRRKNAYEAIKDDYVRGVPIQDGTVCFAASGPDTRTASICIFLGSFEQLGRNRWEAPIGQVCPESLEVLHSIYTGWGDLPQCGGVGPDPIELEVLGSSYILHNFPGIDFVETATWVEH